MLRDSKELGSDEDRLISMPLLPHAQRIDKQIDRLRKVIKQQREAMLNYENELQEKSKLRTLQTDEVIEVLYKNIDKLKESFNKSLSLEKESIGSLQAEVRRVGKQHLKLQQSEIVVERQIVALQNQIGFKEMCSHMYRS